MAEGRDHQRLTPGGLLHRYNASSRSLPTAQVGTKVSVAGMDDKALLKAIKGEAIAVMLYGSCARGDATPDSDIDLLQLAEKGSSHYQVGPVSVSVYTTDELARMCRAGSLFALHLSAEGRVLQDPTGILAATLSTYMPPTTYDRFWTDLEAVAQCLDATIADLTRNPEGFARLAMYLVRTSAILRVIENTGRPCFSIGSLADQLDIPSLVSLFEGREDPRTVNLERYRLGRSILEELLGHGISNPYESLEALAVNLEHEHQVATRMAISLLAGENTLGYGDILLDPTLTGR